MKDWTGNKKSVLVTTSALHQSDAVREENDFYATEPEAIDRLLAVCSMPKDKTIWECACGNGNLSKRLEELGFSDVVSTDLVDRGYGVGGVNFLTDFSEEGSFDGTILTNPPYRYAVEFCKQALKLVSVGNRVYMFLRIQFLETKKRAEWFRTGKSGLKTVYVFGERIGCWINNQKKGSSAQAYCWFEFEKGYEGEVTVKWL